MELIKNKDQKQDGDKRDYVPYTLVWNCKKCNAEIKTDFSDVYFSYPIYGEPHKTTIYYDCDCGYENEEKITVKITKKLELLGENKLSNN